MSEFPRRRKWFLQRQGGGVPFIDSYLHPGCAILKITRAPTFEDAAKRFKRR